jgi:hypothetical protein
MIYHTLLDLPATIEATKKIGEIFPHRDKFRLENLKQLDIEFEDAKTHFSAQPHSCCNTLWAELTYRMVEWKCWRRATTLGVTMWWSYKADAYRQQLPTHFVDSAQWFPLDTLLAQQGAVPKMKKLHINLTAVGYTPRDDIWCDGNKYIKNAILNQGVQAFTRTMMARRSEVVITTDS